MFSPFPFFAQHALPLVYDDSLSYYECVCKLQHYINGLTRDLSAVESEVSALDATTQQQASDIAKNKSDIADLKSVDNDQNEQIERIKTLLADVDLDFYTLGDRFFAELPNSAYIGYAIADYLVSFMVPIRKPIEPGYTISLRSMAQGRISNANGIINAGGAGLETHVYYFGSKFIQIQVQSTDISQPISIGGQDLVMYEPVVLSADYISLEVIESVT